MVAVVLAVGYLIGVSYPSAGTTLVAKIKGITG
jgi:hypothetical protein